MVRAFIAVEIENPQTLSKILKFRDEVAVSGADVKPVEDENIHLTIRFLGEISEYTLREIQNILSTIKMQPIYMHIRGVGAFPDIVRPRVVWVGIVKGFNELKTIRDYIDRGIAERRLVEVHRDQHEFSPHITVARVRSGRGLKALIDVINRYADHDFGETVVTKIVLKQSILTPRGPIYRDLFLVKLG